MRYPNSQEAAYLAINIYGALQKGTELIKLHEYLCRKRHDVIVEIGTCNGGMAWWLAHLPGFNKLISVDLPGGDFGGGPTPKWIEVMKNWVSADYDVSLCTGDSQKEATVEEVKAELPQGLCDVLFIDADHSYEGVKRDFELWKGLVRNGGVILFHDICDHSSTNPACQVKRFWDELKESMPYAIFYEIIDPSCQTWGGIGVVEV